MQRVQQRQQARYVRVFMAARAGLSSSRLYAQRLENNADPAVLIPDNWVAGLSSSGSFGLKRKPDFIAEFSRFFGVAQVFAP